MVTHCQTQKRRRRHLTWLTILFGYLWQATAGRRHTRVLLLPIRMGTRVRKKHCWLRRFCFCAAVLFLEHFSRSACSSPGTLLCLPSQVQNLYRDCSKPLLETNSVTFGCHTHSTTPTFPHLASVNSCASTSAVNFSDSLDD